MSFKHASSSGIDGIPWSFHNLEAHSRERFSERLSIVCVQKFNLELLDAEILVVDWYCHQPYEGLLRLVEHRDTYSLSQAVKDIQLHALMSATYKRIRVCLVVDAKGEILSSICISRYDALSDWALPWNVVFGNVVFRNVAVGSVIESVVVVGQLRSFKD